METHYVFWTGMSIAFVGFIIFVYCDIVANNSEDEKLPHYFRLPGWDEISDWELLCECKHRHLIDDDISQYEEDFVRKQSAYKLIDKNKDMWFVKNRKTISFYAMIVSLVSILISFCFMGGDENGEETPKTKSELKNDSTVRSNIMRDFTWFWFMTSSNRR